MTVVITCWIIYAASAMMLWSFFKVERVIDFFMIIFLVTAIVTSFSVIRVESTKEKFAEQGMYLKEDSK